MQQKLPKRVVPYTNPKLVFQLLKPTDIILPGDWQRVAPENYNPKEIVFGWVVTADLYFNKPGNTYEGWLFGRPIPHLCNLPDYCYA